MNLLQVSLNPTAQRFVHPPYTLAEGTAPQPLNAHEVQKQEVPEEGGSEREVAQDEKKAAEKKAKDEQKALEKKAAAEERAAKTEKVSEPVKPVEGGPSEKPEKAPKNKKDKKDKGKGKPKVESKSTSQLLRTVRSWCFH